MVALFRFNISQLLLNTCKNATSASRPIRLISTNKSGDKATNCPPIDCPPRPCNTAHNWISYGFDYRCKAHDRNNMRSTCFFSVTLCLVFGTFIWSYLPDPQMRSWAQREAYLVIREREAAGEELISPNYVNPICITLPSEEQLFFTEIIV